MGSSTWGPPTLVASEGCCEAWEPTDARETGAEPVAGFGAVGVEGVVSVDSTASALFAGRLESGTCGFRVEACGPRGS